MKDFKKILLLFILLGVSSISYTQLVERIDRIPIKKLPKFAENSLEKGDIYSAIEYLERYCEKKYMDYEQMFKLAKLCLQARDYTKAEKYFKDLTENAYERYPKAIFYYADVVKRRGDYKEAIKLFEKFDKEYRRRDFSKWADNQIEGCEMALNEKIEPANLDIARLGNSINKPFIEFSPIIWGRNELVFGSLPSDTLPYYTTNTEKITIPYRKFYVAKRVNDLEWEYKDTLAGPFNSKEAHTGNGVLSHDGRRFYFTRCKVDWQNNVKCHIYVSHKKKGKWQKPEKMPYPVNVAEYSSTMPTLGMKTRRRQKLEVLYFVSDRPFRSQGGWDIWYSRFDYRDSAFTDVRNCGRRINTSGDEITPYYDLSSRTLYFSSDYWPGYGGFDIFKIQGNERRWKRNNNIGKPINTGADELYYALNPKQKAEGFFTSNRAGGAALINPTCCDDIYTFYNKDYINLAVKGTVYNIPADTEDIEAKKRRGKFKPLENAEIILYTLIEKDSLSEEADIEEEEALFEIASDTTDENGRYLLTLEKEEDYRMMFKKDGYFYEKVNISTHNKVRSDTFEYDAIYLEEISKEPIVFYIYYEFDQYELTKKAKNKIDTTLYAILEETPDIIVEISSHTDSQGDSAYNQELSQKRAQKVVDYLIKKGIEESRLVAKGYGETQPIADNDTPEGRAKNRRTEFAVIGSKDPFSKLNVSEFRIISKDNKKGTIEEKQEEGKKEEDEDEKVDDKKEEKEEKKEEKKTFNKRQKPPSKTNRRF